MKKPVSLCQHSKSSGFFSAHFTGIIIYTIYIWNASIFIEFYKSWLLVEILYPACKASVCCKQSDSVCHDIIFVVMTQTASALAFSGQHYVSQVCTKFYLAGNQHRIGCKMLYVYRIEKHVCIVITGKIWQHLKNHVIDIHPRQPNNDHLL